MPLDLLLDGIRAIIRRGESWSPMLEREVRDLIWSHDEWLLRDHHQRRHARVLAWIQAHEGKPTTHDEIADAVYMARETVTRCLHNLRGDGQVEWVQTDYRRRGYFLVDSARP